MGCSDLLHLIFQVAWPTMVLHTFLNHVIMFSENVIFLSNKYRIVNVLTHYHFSESRGKFTFLVTNLLFHVKYFVRFSLALQNL